MSCDFEKLSYTADKSVLQKIINNWFKLAKGEALPHDDFDIFIKFMSSWVAFNAIYEFTCSAVQRDREKVIAFSTMPMAQEIHTELMIVPTYKEAVTILAEKGILKLPSNSNRQHIGDINNLKEVLLCVYQVRCNLFHGGKTPESPRDREVVQAAYEIVTRLMEPFIVKINEV